MSVLGDCSLVEVAEPIQVRQDGEMATRLGLASYMEMDSGRCYYWTDDILYPQSNNATTGSLPIILEPDQQLEYYVQDVLGSQWYPSIALSVTAVLISFLWFLYVTSYCCSTQVRGVRIFNGFMVALVFVAVQGLTFVFLGTEWCDTNQCQVGRTAGFAYASCVAFFLSGAAFIFMSNYPGEASLAKLQQEHHNHVMVGDDEEAQPLETAAVGMEEREEEPPEEDLLPGDQNYEAREEDIEKTLTAKDSEDPEAAVESQPEEPPNSSEKAESPPEAQSAQEEESTKATADAESSPAVAEDAQSKNNSEPITAEAVLVTESSPNPPRPPSLDEGEA